MLNKEKVIELYQENYQMAIEDGHKEEATSIAWNWTEDDVLQLFRQYKEQHQTAHQEAVNNAFFG